MSPVRQAVVALGFALAASLVTAQEFPTRAVRVIVPQPPGGGFDLVARTLADKLPEGLGQPVIVENRPGAGTLVGTEIAAKAPADGYTLLLGGTPNLSLNAGLYRSLPYDPARDFVPVGLAVAYSYTIITRKDLPQTGLKDLVGYAKTHPEKLTYASGGNGTGQHIGAAVFANLAGIKMTHVPYKGAQAAYQDLLAGRVDLFFDNTSTARAHVDAGSVKALAVSTRDRIALHPQVPTINETGVAQFEMESYFGYFAPARTPRPVVDRLRAEFAKVMQMPEVIARFERTGARVLRLGAAETEKIVAQDIEKWTRLIRQADIRED